MKTDKIIKISLAILMFICLGDMPYSFFQLVRFLALVGFSTLAYMSYLQKREIEMIVFIALAVLFQPLLKIALGRELWNIIDVIVGIGLIVSVFTNKVNKT